MIYDMTNYRFSGKPPPGEPFTFTDAGPHGKATIMGVYTEDGVLYITGQQWEPMPRENPDE